MSKEEWQAQFKRECLAYEADPLARAIGSVVLTKCGNMTVRSIVGTYGVLQIVDAAKKGKA